jgi:organic radical activating enzyme
MHSTTSPFGDFEKYKKTAKFINDYYAVYSEHHRENWKIMISFTGGEPTVNPAFFDLLTHMKENYPFMQLNLTTNGTWGERKGKFLLEHLNSITVSYHCEGTEKQKQLVRNNLLWVNNTLTDKKKLKVNVMMHQEYFDECVDLIENFLKPNGIRYIPRVIGDDAEFKSKWFVDNDGSMRRTSHTYTDEQLAYLKNHWDGKNLAAEVNRVKSNVIKIEKLENYIPTNSPSCSLPVPAPVVDKIQPIEIASIVVDGLARKMGRMCCGGRCMTVKQNNEIKDAAFIEQSNFKGYHCMINWFFLHIEEDKNAVYHHQTCMAKLPGTPDTNLDLIKFTKTKFTDEVGPITSLTESDNYLKWLKTQFANGKTPTMICPNTHCGCGICITKANNEQDFREIANKFIKLGEEI